MKKLISTLFLLCFSILAFCQTTTVTLTGTLVSKASDATSVTYKWTQVAGTNVSITSPTSLTTTIPNVGAGVYKFQLIGTDNFGIVSAPSFVNITVNRYATVPVVNAGVDQTITLGSTGFVNNKKVEYIVKVDKVESNTALFNSNIYEGNEPVLSVTAK